jgi:hypothetical protein
VQTAGAHTKQKAKETNELTSEKERKSDKKKSQTEPAPGCPLEG